MNYLVLCCMRAACSVLTLVASGPVMQARAFSKPVLKLLHNPAQPFLPRRVQDVGAALSARCAAAGELKPFHNPAQPFLPRRVQDAGLRWAPAALPPVS